MKQYEIQALETIIILALWALTRYLLKRAIKRIAIKFHVAIERRRIVVRITNFITLIFGIISITLVWGVDQRQLLVFFTSTITVLGIAFFAQWSLLSNITAGLVIFFNHPLKLGDTIRITEKDYLLEGRLDSISFFFLHIETKNGEKVTVPNSIALQKTIAVLHDHPNESPHTEEPFNL